MDELQQMCPRLVYLVIFLLARCDAGPLSDSGRIHLCGKSLADALSAVCRGRYYDTLSKRSELQPWLENDIFKNKDEKENIRDSEWSVLPHALKRSQYSGLHDECCIVPCSFRTLESYCSF